MTAETDRLPRRDVRGRDLNPRSLLLSGVLLGGLALPGVQAQAVTPLAQKPAQSAPVSTARTTPKPLSDAEKQTLKTLFSKVRPATLRIEQCDLNQPGACDDPDGIGSGVLISADGLALTAYHVVEGARFLSAQTADKKRYAVEVVGYDDQDDLALLRVSVPRGTPFVPLASARPGVGDAVLAVGNGGGGFLQPKSGRLTGLEASAGPGGATFPPGTLQMSAPLVPGDSGGPILNTRGELTGIVSYISISRNSGPASFAVPVTASDARLADLRAGKKLDAPIIGIGLNGPFTTFLTLDAADFRRLSDVLKLGDTPGAFFTSVVRGSPADRAGLKPLELDDQDRRVSGDIVTAVDGKRIINFDEFQYAVRTYKPGDTITLSVLRGDKPLTVKLTLIGRSQTTP
ncbi:S1C family serine protease [Deinococcus radiopugnans]|uniref:Serine protease n=1 Tax=Deinococcus radiopugnans ATCC 19172 TaxID=585398 RepID=A0A5C4Y8V4_9DEIO|nr:S1C family serine protease [Deinococcus radiopugnans]MBB6017748.1 S1-C subfamily serine protease [Deinococcus radiopugnans ATCC 19172]TNM71447.1 serine protease [Deinococcus radiopugnans ATCC 19172]